MRSLIKWIVISLGANPRFFAAHSLREGGASTLCANGVSLEEVKRFGRWVSDTFHIYLYGGSLNLRGLSDALVHGKWLLGQVKVANSQRLKHMPERATMRRNKVVAGDFDHCVGVTARATTLGNVATTRQL